MTKIARQAAYASAKLFVAIGLVSTLSACQNAILTPSLVADDIFELGSFPEGAEATHSLYVRRFIYEDVGEVELSYMGVRGGEVTPIWEGRHKMVSGSRNGSTLLALFQGSRENPEALQVSFSFPDGQTTVSGEGRLLTLEDLADESAGEQTNEQTGDEGAIALQKTVSISWDAPAGTVISLTEPTLVYWQAWASEATATNAISFDSIDEITEFSREQPDLTFQAVTLEVVN